MAFKATVEPKLMRAIATPERKETITALSGMFHPGETYQQILSVNGNYQSGNIRWLGFSWKRLVKGLIDREIAAYLCQPWAKWQTVIPRKTPYLSACSGNLTYDSGNQRDNYQCNHDIRACVAVGNIVEELDKRVAGRTTEERLRVGNGKAKRQDCDVAKDGVEGDTPKDGTWKSLGRIFYFFCCCAPFHVRTLITRGVDRGC